MDKILSGLAKFGLDEKLVNSLFEEESTNDKKVEPMSRATIVLFIVSGVYLIGTWIMNTISGFLI